jgi:hypothetical protein
MMTKSNLEAILCDSCNGVPIAFGVRSAYYHFDHLGERRLVLNQKEHDRLLIDNSVEITVLTITDDEVKFGVLWQ